MIRAIEPADSAVWATLRSRLWPNADPLDLERECMRFAQGDALPNVSAVFIAEDEACADGCAAMPVPHIEGLYVKPAARRKGLGVVLIQAAEEWARSRGFAEIASDTEAENHESRRVHAACGFMEVEHAIKFRKSLA